MMSHDAYAHDHDPIEGYCVRCRTSVEIETPLAVWTRKGQPATRGICPLCGGVVFRIGKTALHDERNRPSLSEQTEASAKFTRVKLSRETVYVGYAPEDEEIAQQIALDLERSGYAVWLHDGEHLVGAWASGVHPALKDCARMVLVLATTTSQDPTVAQAWGFFRDQRKQIVVAQVTDTPPPDALRRCPRFAFGGEDYKGALRQTVNALG